MKAVIHFRKGWKLNAPPKIAVQIAEAMKAGNGSEKKWRRSQTFEDGKVSMTVDLSDVALVNIFE